MRALIVALPLLAGCFDFSRLLGDGGAPDAGAPTDGALSDQSLSDGAAIPDLATLDLIRLLPAWHTEHTGLPALRGVWAGPGLAIAVGDNGLALVSLDGLTWNPVGTGGAGLSLNAVSGDGNDVYAVGLVGSILHATAAGLKANGTFSNQTNANVATVDLNGVWCCGPNGLALAVGDAGTLIYRSGNQWHSMMPISQDAVVSAWGNGVDQYYAVGLFAEIERSSDGMQWKTLTNNYMSVLTGMFGRQTNQGYEYWLVGGDNFTSTYLGYSTDGATFGPPPNNAPAPPGNLTGVAGDGNSVWMVGVGGAMMHYDGAAWDTSSPGNGNFTGVAVDDLGRVFVVDTKGDIYVRY